MQFFDYIVFSVYIFVTCRLGLHVSGKLATDAVVVSTDVVKTPSRELLGSMELSTNKINIWHICSCDIFSVRFCLFVLVEFKHRHHSK